MANTFCHIELHSSAPDEAKTFYTKLFGWGMQDMPMGDQTYTMFKTAEGDGEIGGGITQKMCQESPSHWVSYVLVDDVAGSVNKAKGLGASVIVDKTEVPEMGWFAILSDPTGAAIGMWQAKAKG